MTSTTLNERQRRIIGLIDCGADAAVIQSELGMSQWTLRDQIKRLRGKLGAETMRDLPDAARAAGVELPPCEDEWVDADDPDAEEDSGVCVNCGRRPEGHEDDITGNRPWCLDCMDEDDDGTIRVE